MKQKGLEIFFKFWNNYFIFSLVLILILIKVSYLQIPFYWDEAWSYAMAIFDMANHGPTLIPGHANEWFTRGHPLFFYFIASSWLVIFGKSVVSAHIFALLISCLSLYLIHFCCRKLFSVSIANIVAITLMSQIMFIAQSTLLLPEIFLMGLSVWVFYLYFQKKWIAFMAVSFCLILSKETALVLFGVLLFDVAILQKLIYKKEFTNNLTFVKELVFVLVPFLFFGIFLGIQKINLGYFFYPEHTNMMTFSSVELIKKIQHISERLFISDMRWVWLLVAVPALFFGIIKRKYTKNEVHIFALSGIFIVSYLLFSSLNFFTIRYLLTMLPFIFLLFIVFIYRSFPNKIGYLLMAVAIVGNLFYGIFKNKGEGDCVRTFYETVLAHKEAVNFCESQQWQNKTISTGFLMNFNLKFPQLGYLNNAENPFANCGNSDAPDIYIFYSNEPNPKIDDIRIDVDYTLIKRIEKPNGCYVEIYESPQICAD